MIEIDLEDSEIMLTKIRSFAQFFLTRLGRRKSENDEVNKAYFHGEKISKVAKETVANILNFLNRFGNHTIKLKVVKPHQLCYSLLGNNISSLIIKF